MKTTNWDKYAVCENCGWFTHAPMGRVFFIDVECCPVCGSDDFRIKTKRFNRENVKLWNPATWLNGFWETRNEDN